MKAETRYFGTIDIEEEIRSALADYFNVYVRPLPASYTLSNLLIQQVGGSEENTISAFEVTIDSRAEEEAEALDLTCTPVKSQADTLMEVAAGTSDAAVIDSLMAGAMIGEGTG